MDPTPAGGLAHLEQYGALGIIAAALLALVVLLVKRFVDHAIDSNKQLQAQNNEMQKENLKAMHAIVTELGKLTYEMRTGVASILNEREYTQSGRERRATRPPINPRGGGSG